jgi:hypothetical protein
MKIERIDGPEILRCGGLLIPLQKVVEVDNDTGAQLLAKQSITFINRDEIPVQRGKK